MLTLSYLQRARDGRRQGSDGGRAGSKEYRERIRIEKWKIMGQRGTSMGKVGTGIMAEMHRRLLKTTRAMKLREAVVARVWCGYSRRGGKCLKIYSAQCSLKFQQTGSVCVCVSVWVSVCMHVLVTTKELEIY